MYKTILFSMFGLFCFLLSCKSAKVDSAIHGSDNQEPIDKPIDYVPGELLVGFKTKEHQKTTHKLEQKEGVHLIRMLMETDDVWIGHFKVPVGKEELYIESFQKLPNVQYAELNHIATISR